MPSSAVTSLPSTGRSFRSCASCQAPVEFDPGSGELKCPFCGTQRSIPRGPVPHHALAEAASLSLQVEGELRTLKCTHCGAQSSVPANVAATQCAFCAAPLANAEGTSTSPAEGVIPFAVTRETAGSHFSEWLRKLWFRPSNLKKLARLREVRGIYIPNWAFDAHADSSWSAEAGYYYYVETVQVVNGREEKRREQRVRWEPVFGNHSADYQDLLVSASKGLEPSELRAIEPFEIGKLTSFSGDFLAGFEAESHAIDVRAGWRQAANRIVGEERDACSRLVPGDTQRNLHVSTSTSDEYVRSFLLPVYIAAYEYGGKIYRVVVNGQTGRVTGKAPWSAWKIAGFVLTLAVVIAAVALLVQKQ